MRIRVIACGVFEPYLEHLASEPGASVSVRVLDAGLHEAPSDLRLQLQREIDQSSDSGEFDAIALLYGLCGRGVANLSSRDIPVAMPRAHDCITLFLGSREEYLRQFRFNPGTLYHTRGWIEQKINPRNRDAAQLYRRYGTEDISAHPDFRRLSDAYGEENAGFILSFLDGWKKNYTRAAYIDLGIPGEDACKAFTRQTAGLLGWKHEEIRGDLDLMRSLVRGKWEDDRIFVLPPRHRVVATGDDRIYDAAALESEGLPDGVFSDRDVVVVSEGGSGGASGIGLGIDAGGTYTDAVVFDMGERRVLAKAKALTTYHDLALGISEALDRLPPDLLRQVQVTSLSTTLATNYIVEGRSRKVGLIALTPLWWHNRQQIGHEPAEWVPGHVTMSGEVAVPLDEEACIAALERLVREEQCDAIVVAGQATIRNPEQAERVRQLANQLFNVPVICDFEVARRLNWINRARTAIANACLLPVIRDLISSVRSVLRERGIEGRLLVVKGDGTPVDESVALERPVETILSGPAASVSGARALTGLDDALVLDIGGTTTDCAVIQDGQVAVAPDGAVVGGSTISVDAVEITTVGLGGDSRLSFTPDRRIVVGPERNIPLCYLAAEHEGVRRFLNLLDPGFYQQSADASALDVLVLAGKPPEGLTPPERTLVELLSGCPLPMAECAARMGLVAPELLPLSRLEGRGVVKRGALTPTDLLHVTGEFQRWDCAAARKALEVFASMMGLPADEVLALALREVTKRVFEVIVRRQVKSEQPQLVPDGPGWDFLVDRAFKDEGQPLKMRVSLATPVVALGAPAETLVKPVDRHLDVRVVVPEHADVANAVGAVAAEITAREEVLIRPGEVSNYVLHGRRERMEFSELARATEAAIELARSRAVEAALKAGAASPRVTVSRRDRTGAISTGGSVFLERRVVAVASGPPALVGQETAARAHT